MESYHIISKIIATLILPHLRVASCYIRICCDVKEWIKLQISGAILIEIIKTVGKGFMIGWLMPKKYFAKS